MRPPLVAVTIVASLLLTAGCSGTIPDPSGDPSSPTGVPSAAPPTPTGGPSPGGRLCSSLTDADTEELLGVDPGTGSDTRSGDVEFCSWVRGGTTLSAVRSDAATWARNLRLVFASIRTAPGMTPAQLKLYEGLVAASTEPGFTAEQACESFAAIAEAASGSRADHLTQLIPSTAAPQSVGVQMCSQGQFASLTVTRPGLDTSATTVSEAMVERLRAMIADGTESSPSSPSAAPSASPSASSPET